MDAASQRHIIASDFALQVGDFLECHYPDGVTQPFVVLRPSNAAEYKARWNKDPDLPFFYELATD